MFARLSLSYKTFEKSLKAFSKLQITNASFQEERFMQPASTFHTSLTLYDRKHGIIYVKPISFLWAKEQAGINLSKYTHEPIPYIKTGGRGMDGHVQYKHVGGGLKRPAYMIDHHRGADPITGLPVVERVLQVRQTFWRHTPIALVARDTHKRWIVAPKGMKEGDIITSSSTIPKIPVIPNIGDSHPVGALPSGTVVSCVERHPGEGCKVSLSAGTSCTIIRHVPSGPEGAHTVLRMMSKREMKIDQRCIAVVGQVGNDTHKLERYYKFGQKRWRGIRQRSGFFQKKTGRFGRKIRPIRAAMSYHTQPKVNRYGQETVITHTFTMPGDPKLKKAVKPRLHRYETLPGEVNPRFRWCSWSSVR